MFDAETEVVQLESRLGRVGSIQAWDPWKSRRSVEDAKWWVSKVASLSYGNEEAKNPEKLFQSIVDRGHLSCLEFVPVMIDRYGHLPSQSLRRIPDLVDRLAAWGTLPVKERPVENPTSAFLVECPLYTRSQWMRHRSFSYLEMSRRYTKGSKVEWDYYGEADYEQNIQAGDLTTNLRYIMACEDEYKRRLDAGWPNEIARGCMPVETMTKFWVAGFDRDWEAFLKLRDDAHAQPEIRVFASWIRAYLETKKASK